MRPGSTANMATSSTAKISGLEPTGPAKRCCGIKNGSDDGDQKHQHDQGRAAPPLAGPGLAAVLWCHGLPMPWSVTTTGSCRRSCPPHVARRPSFLNSSYPVCRRGAPLVQPECHEDATAMTRHHGHTMPAPPPDPGASPSRRRAGVGGGIRCDDWGSQRGSPPLSAAAEAPSATAAGLRRPPA